MATAQNNWMDNAIQQQQGTSAEQKTMNAKEIRQKTQKQGPKDLVE